MGKKRDHSALASHRFSAPIAIAFPGGQREFKSLSDVAQFIDEEIAAWSFFPKESNQAAAKFNDLKEVLRRASNDNPPPSLDRIAIDLTSHLTVLSRELPLHNTVQFQFVKRAFEEYGIKRNIKLLFPTTISLRDDAIDRTDFFGLILQFISADKANADEYRPQVNELQSKLDEMRELIAQERQNLDDLRAEYKSISDTKEPAKYWNDKAEKHLHAEKTWGCIAIGAVIGWLLVLGLAYWWVHGTIVEETSSHPIVSAHVIGQQPPSVGPPSDGPSQSQPIVISPWYLLSRSFPLVALSVCAFWSLRILVRNYLTNLHLRIDAQERVILTKTYQTLLKGDRSLNEKGFDIILGQLFRHSQSGVVNDAAPAYPPVLEMITRPPSRD